MWAVQALGILGDGRAEVRAVLREIAAGEYESLRQEAEKALQGESQMSRIIR